MRGRKPRPLTLAVPDVPILQAVARARDLAWFQVQHARIVLAVTAGESIEAIAGRLECDRATVWRVCRRYEEGGLKKLLLDEPRLGRPQEISPPPARSGRRTGLPGAGRQGPAHHPLDQRRPGPPGRRRSHRQRDQSPHGSADPARRRFAAPPHALLEDQPPRCPVQGAGRRIARCVRLHTGHGSRRPVLGLQEDKRDNGSRECRQDDLAGGNYSAYSPFPIAGAATH